jgi:2,3-bisphosphoglycerate-dependent phosphoglycerate mutase
MAELVLLRHGRSLSNETGQFTGWTDVPLSPAGIDEARAAGERLRTEGRTFQVAYTSVLSRAVQTLWIVLEQLDLLWIPVHRAWRLNDRCLGQLEGCRRDEVVARWGRQALEDWWYGIDHRPPARELADPRHPSHDPRYATVPARPGPDAESFAEMRERVLACWRERLEPQLRGGRNVLVVAHGSSLRALVQALEGLPDDGITRHPVPTATPLVYTPNPSRNRDSSSAPRSTSGSSSGSASSPAPTCT